MLQPKSENSSPIRIFFLQAHSPIHIGVGEGVGHLNLPTARESVTHYPYIPGTSVKGVLREQAEIQNQSDDESRYGPDTVVQIFGPPTERAGDARGGVVFSDARLLFLPLRSLIGGFALLTCPLILSRFQRELKLAGRLTGNVKTALSELSMQVNDEHALVAPDSLLVYPSSPGSEAPRSRVGESAPVMRSVLLEDLRFLEQSSPLLSTLATELKTLGAWDDDDHALYSSRLVVVSDTNFAFFVESGLEIRHRVKIDDQTGTAAASGPWTEEYIPAESLFFGMVQGRKTVLFYAPDDNTRAEKQDPIHADAQSNLQALKGLVEPEMFLRFGGKSSGGAGRAFFRLA